MARAVDINAQVVIDPSGFDGVVSASKTRGATLKASRAGIKVLIPASRAGAPVRTRSLRKAQHWKAKRGKRGLTISYAVQKANAKFDKMLKVGKTIKRVRPAWYDHLVQGGTKPHMIGSWRHPGAKANPYRERAYRAKKAEMGKVVLRTFGQEMEKLIVRAHAKLRGK